MSEVSLLSPPEIHPEFGYFWPSARIRRRLRLAIIAAGSLGILAAGGQISLMAEQNFELLNEVDLARAEAPNETDLARLENVALPDRQAVVPNSYAAVILPSYKRKRPATHPLAFVSIGRHNGPVLEQAEIKSTESPAPAPKRAALNNENRKVRTVTVHDGRRQHSPQVFVVPTE